VKSELEAQEIEAIAQRIRNNILNIKVLAKYLNFKKSNYGQSAGKDKK